MTQRNAELNRLLIDLGRSLLQYVGESWPWTAYGEEAVRAEFEQLVERQAQCVGRIIELLDERTWPIDFGIYPPEYTDLHFLSLEFLLRQLVVNADELVAVVKGVQAVSQDDPVAAEMLDDVLADQQLIANKLREMATAREHAELGEPLGE